MKGQDLMESMVVFFIVFIIAGVILTGVFGDARIGFSLSLLAGIIVSGGGKLFWYIKSQI